MSEVAHVVRRAMGPQEWPATRRSVPGWHACRPGRLGVSLAAMPAVSLRAHFDGERILLDEPFEIPPNAPLMVTVLPPADSDQLATDWPLIGRASLARAFGDDEPEYTVADLRP